MQYRELTLTEKYVLIYISYIIIGISVLGIIICTSLMCYLGSVDIQNDNGFYLSFAFVIIFVNICIQIFTNLHFIKNDDYIWVRYKKSGKKKLVNMYCYRHLTIDDRLEIRSHRRNTIADDEWLNEII